MALPSYEELVGEEALPSYEELTTPTTAPKPATIRSEGQGPAPREDGFLGKMRAIFAPTPEAVAYGQQQFTASPEELEALPAQMAAQQAAQEQVIREHQEPLPVIPGEENLVEPPFIAGIRSAVQEAIPRNVSAAAGMLAEGVAPAWTAGREVIQAGKNIRDLVRGKPFEEVIPPEKPFTEYTPEDWGKFTGRMGLQAAMAIPVFKGLRPHIGPPTGIKVPEEVRPALPEAIARQREAQLRAAVEKPTLPEPIGPGTAADAVTKAVDELRFQEAAPAINRQLAREEPTAPSMAEATEPAPTVREAISLDELRLMRERGELEAQPKDATGRSHPAVEERIAQINQDLTNIANRALQEATAGGEPSASEITEPTSLGVQSEGEGVGRTPPLQQPRKTPELLIGEEAVPGGGATPEAEAAVVKVEHGEHAKPGYTAVPTEDLPYAGGEPPPVEPPPVTTGPMEEPQARGISQARTEAELGVGSVEPGVGAEMGSGFAFGRNYLNKGGDPRLPIRRATTHGMVGKNDVGIVHAELDRLRAERSAAAEALEANPADPVLQENFSRADDAQRAWRKELQPVLTKASDALREAHATSMPNADPATYQGLADLMDEHFKGQRVVTPEMRTAMAKAAKGVRGVRDIANSEMRKIENTLGKQMKGKRIMTPEELDLDLKRELETTFADCILGA